MISCDKSKSLIVPFLEEELSTTDVELILEHLESCSECSELVSDLSNFEMSKPSEYQSTMSEHQIEHLDELLLAQFGTDHDAHSAFQNVQVNSNLNHDERILTFPNDIESSQDPVFYKASEQKWISKESVLIAALFLSFFWGAYQSYQVEKLHSVIQEQQHSLQLQQQSIKRMESVMQVRPSSPEPYIMTVSHVPRRRDL